MRVNFDENNSGGWWLDQKQYEALFSAGWKLAEGWDKQYDGYHDPALPWLGSPSDTVPYGWRHNLYLDPTTSMEAAKASFGDATGEDPDAEGCKCCGQPFYFFTEAR
jgi:hypothetical protein